MGLPLFQTARIGAYVAKQTLSGRKRYPIVLMLEPLYRCNLACAGCGKIDYPDEILNQRLSYDQCMEAIDECERISGKKLQWTYMEDNRIGDHIWWVSDVRKFQAHYPGWKFRYGLKEILNEIHTACSTA